VPTQISDLLDWLENTDLADTIRQSLWLYPALEITHIIGITIVVGAALMFDLRLLGSSKDLPIPALSRHLLPWSRRGLWLIIPSGFLLFMTNATALGNDTVFWLKMILLIIAALNVLIFHKLIFKREYFTDHPIPFTAKISALVSVIIWISIIACGRLLAY
jgi:hypothetical protein